MFLRVEFSVNIKVSRWSFFCVCLLRFELVNVLNVEALKWIDALIRIRSYISISLIFCK